MEIDKESSDHSLGSGSSTGSITGSITGSRTHSTHSTSSYSDDNRQAILYTDDTSGVETGVPSNNWTEENTNTVMNWRESLIKTSFIYQYIIDNYQRKYNIISVIMLFFSTISTLISAVTVTTQTINEHPYRLASFIISIVILAINAVGLFLNGLLKIYKFDDIFTSYSGYIDRVDHLYAIVDGQLTVPTEQRDDANIFIKEQSKVYGQLIQQSPNISISNYNSAMKQYRKFLTSNHDGINFKLAQKRYKGCEKLKV